LLDAQRDVIESGEIAELSRDVVDDDGFHRGTRTNAAMPTRKASAPLSIRTRVANTWSARSSAVCKLRGVNSPTSLTNSTVPENVCCGNVSTKIGTSRPGCT